MTLFTSKPKPKQAYLKMGIYGNAGSGKTYTASQVARGLALYLKEKTGKQPPVAFLDTETGSTWVEPLFKEHGVDFGTKKARPHHPNRCAARHRLRQTRAGICRRLFHAARAV